MCEYVLGSTVLLCVNACQIRSNLRPVEQPPLHTHRHTHTVTERERETEKKKEKERESVPSKAK